MSINQADQHLVLNQDIQYLNQVAVDVKLCKYIFIKI